MQFSAIWDQNICQLLSPDTFHEPHTSYIFNVGRRESMPIDPPLPRERSSLVPTGRLHCFSHRRHYSILFSTKSTGIVTSRSFMKWSSQNTASQLQNGRLMCLRIPSSTNRGLGPLKKNLSPICTSPETMHEQRLISSH